MRLIITIAPLLLAAACSDAPSPPDNARVDDGGKALASAPVNVGGEGATLPACPSVSRVVDAGTQVYWAPGETRAIKANLPGGVRVALCEATPDDRWFGVVFPAPGGDMDLCGVAKPVASAREYQGPCRWGWIKGGTVQLGK